MARFATVISFIHPWDAYIAKGRLEVEGIPVMVADEYYVWARWTYSQVWGGIKLQVLSEHVGEAEKIIIRHLRGEYEEALYEVCPDVEKVKCPRCQSENYRFSASYNSLALSVLLTFGFGIVIPPVKERRKCNECGCVWR